MKNSLNKINVFKDFRKELIDRYGTKTAEDIWRYANEEYMKLLSNEADAEKYAREYVFPAVAIYRAVETFKPGEEMEVTRAFGTKTGLRLKKLFRRVTALPGFPEFMWRNMDRIAAKMSDGYEIKNLYVDSDKCDMDVVICPLYDKAKEIGTPEAVQMICCMDKEYMNGFRGVDYTRTKSVAEGDECCDYRLSRSKEDIYEMQLSDARWWAYDIPGNIGWITWIVCNIKALKNKRDYFSILSIIPSGFMLLGVMELISERISKLGRILPKKRVYRGFGALTLGGILGVPIAMSGILCKEKRKKSIWMLAGTVLCTIFAGLCFMGYKKKE